MMTKYEPIDDRLDKPDEELKSVAESDKGEQKWYIRSREAACLLN